MARKPLLFSGTLAILMHLAAARTAMAVTLAPDWSPVFGAVWFLDESSDGTVAVTRQNSGGACPGTDCDLTDVQNTGGGFTPGDEVNVQQGLRSALFQNAQVMVCQNTTCDEILPASGESVTAGCWARHTAANIGPMMSAWSSSLGGWYLEINGADAAHASIAFGVGNNGTPSEATSDASTLPVDTWTHVVGRFNNTSAEARVFIDGAASGAGAAPPGFNAVPPFTFALSAGATGYTWDGNLDECFVIKTPLSDADICRICSCGIDGSLCGCNDADPTLYDSNGRNTTECGTCALPACNLAPPSVPTATPTATPTDTGTPVAPTPTASDTATPTATPTATTSSTPTGTATPTATATATPSATATQTPTPSAPVSATPTATPTATTSSTPTGTATPTRSATPTPTATTSSTPTRTATPTATATATPSATVTRTPTPSAPVSATPTATPTATKSSTPTGTATPTPTATASAVPAQDWGASFVSVWSLDESSSGTTPITRQKSAGTCPGADCNLTDVQNAVGGYTAGDAVNKQQGLRSALFQNAQVMVCQNTSCDEILPASGESVTAGCWARHTAATLGPIISAWGSSTGGWYLDSNGADGTHTSIIFGVGNTGTPTEATSNASALPLNTWTHVVGRFNNASAASQVFIDGAASGAGAAPPGFNAVPPTTFALSTSAIGYSWDGNLDECFVIKTPLSDADICRICSCGIDGALCTCDASAPASYTNTGRNAAQCGGCTLPACDAAVPGAPTATPTVTATPTPTLTATATLTPVPTVSATPTGSSIPTATPSETSAPAETPTPTPTASGVPICAAAPEVCRTPAVAGKATLLIQDKPGDSNDSLSWKWLKGAMTTKAEFANPVLTDDYALCIYDATGLLASMAAPADGICTGKPCWVEKTTGYRYKTKDLIPGGLAEILLKEGADSKAQVLVKGKGVNLLPLPDLSTLQSPVTVQLRQTANGTCWGAVYSFPPAIKNDATTFKDKAD